MADNNQDNQDKIRDGNQNENQNINKDPNRPMNQDEATQFVRERIKKRPMNKRRLMLRTVTTAALAVIFGLIACLTFLILEPLISNYLYPEEEVAVETVTFPEEEEEMTPEEMLTDTMQQQLQQYTDDALGNEGEADAEVSAGVELSAEQVEEILSSVVLDKNSYAEIYDSLSEYINELKKCMVTVTCIRSSVDWMNNVMESSDQIFGLMIAENGRDLLILTEYGSVRECERLSLTFYDGTKADAQLMSYFEDTDLAILSVPLDGYMDESGKEIPLAQFGSSRTSNIEGTPVIVLGSPLGMNGSMGYGIVAGRSSRSAVDIDYNLLVSDIYGSSNAVGVMFDLQGRVIGIITNSSAGEDVDNLITAYGISDLRGIIEKLSNGQEFAYMGINGIDVSEEAHLDENVPFGAYVTGVEMDSPAMMAGIAVGDVITSLGDRSVSTFQGYTAALMEYEPSDVVEVTLMRLSQEEYREMTFNIILE